MIIQVTGIALLVSPWLIYESSVNCRLGEQLVILAGLSSTFGVGW